jgi:ribokinase
VSEAPVVVVVGSANMDLVVQVERFPSPGETVRGDGFATYPGGKGANQAVAAARLGGRVEFVGCVGADAFGASLRTSLEEAGAGTSCLRMVEGVSTGVATIAVDRAGQNEIVVVAGANGRLTHGDVHAAFAKIGRAAAVLVQLETPLEAVQAALEGARGLGAIAILNPAPAAALPAELLAHVDLITPNETEAHALTGVTPADAGSCAEAAARLCAMGAREVVLTLGEEGCFWAGPGLMVPSVRVDAVDTTAAGDAFNGALALFLAEGMAMPDALAWANRAGALCATRRGAQPAMGSRAEVFALGA